MAEPPRTSPHANDLKPAAVPAGTIVYAVGDIHGQIHLLDHLLATIETDSESGSADRRVLIFIGDYIDRGPDSAAVIERLVSGLPNGFETHYLKGNHEHILLGFLENPEKLQHWLMNGAAETLRSYGVAAPDELADLEAFAECRDAFLAALPGTHLEFLQNLSLTKTVGDYLFVHAGIRPGVPLEDQSAHDLLWIREEFLDCDDDLGVVVVHGHTPGPEPVERSNRIGIDTGAWVYGRLTAVRLQERSRTFLTADDAARDA